MKKPRELKKVRCAIYTRKSTEEGLEQEFNSLDAQRESAESYIKSMKHEGWEPIATHFDDGGFTGGNMDRPALSRLIGEIERGTIDCVIVYKVDRLSRSLLDFSKLIDLFDRNGVSFVSVTQDFNTTNSMGRLTLNILLSFAQFEREIISERTRDKMAAARRRGKYIGGVPVLGYDVDREARKLVVNEREAAQVREIFAEYLSKKSLLATADQLRKRGWTTKRWTTKTGKLLGGVPFDKNRLHHLLKNVVYIGKIGFDGKVFEGEHVGIVDEDVFESVQSVLRENYMSGGSCNKHGALLRGLIHCVSCGCRMVPSQTGRSRGRRYRYYVCSNAQKTGWRNCPAPSLPAVEIEKFVVDKIRGIGNDQRLVAETESQVHRQIEETTVTLNTERIALEKELRGIYGRLRETVGRSSPDIQADLQERIAKSERRIDEIKREVESLTATSTDNIDVATILRDFDELWKSISTDERARILGLLLERIDHDGNDSTVTISFRETGLEVAR